MSRFATLVVALVIGTTGLAPDVEAIPSCMGADNVTGLGAAGCTSPGKNVTIRENVCATPFNNGECTGDQNSFISEFASSHLLDGGTELTPTTEPATLLLLGSSLAAAGVAVRKRARRAAPEPSA